MRRLFLLVFVILFSCNSNQKENQNKKEILKSYPAPAPYFTAIKANDVKLGKPDFGDWLESHKEKGQSFEQFMNSKHVVPTKENNIIYLQPIGEFNLAQTEQIELVREYLELFFQLETKVLNKVSNDIIPKKARRIGDVGQEQFLAGFILNDILKEEKPKNGIALMALTEKDLYPKPEWNYVFGLASYRDKIAVSSMYRMKDETNPVLSLSRLLKIGSHEIGHMFGLHHCIEANCVMNGTNSMSETDKHSIRLCSLCQRKLNSGFKYDDVKRLGELADFFKRNNLTDEFQLMEKDISSNQ
ncbi:archaemetzincin [Flavobacterium branchiicola]|uniref:Archaemetzincin n=1 Tax=Flavobacterium branchiicola TaxID=1114875 RepID=A0ABV9PLN0_9FLAO|nr:archaemetzincin [Flavobacterium branchiicola]MBS7255889.1 Zn-dependent protease [Flavobacterium branchiicola]